MKALRSLVGIGVFLLLVGCFVGLPDLREQTENQSPGKTATYQQNDLDLSNTCSSPAKKGREILGGPVPLNS